MGIFLYLLVIWGNFLDVVLLSNSLIRRDKNTIHWRSEPGNSPHFLRKYFSKSLSFGLCVFGGRQVGSVVVLNTCLCVVLLSNARERGGGEESQITAKGVTLHGKRSPD